MVRAQTVRRTLAVMLALAGPLAAAPGAHGFSIGSGTDPAGDATDPAGARDLLGVGMAYDPGTGKLEAVVALREAATDETSGLLTVFAARRTPTGCDGYPAAGFGADTPSFEASWNRLDAPGVAPAARGDADKTGFTRTVQRFEAEAAELRGLRPDCAVATLTAPRDPTVVYDTVTVALEPQPLLEAELGDVPVLRPGRTRTVALRLRNPGSAPTARVALSVRRMRGIRVGLPRRVAAVRPGGRRTVRVRFTATSKARSPSRLRLDVRAGELRARTEQRLVVRLPSRGGGGGGDAPIQSLCTRYSPDPFGDTGGSLILVPCVR